MRCIFLCNINSQCFVVTTIFRVLHFTNMKAVIDWRNFFLGKQEAQH